MAGLGRKWISIDDIIKLKERGLIRDFVDNKKSEQGEEKKQKKEKYRNKRVVFNGIPFQSTKECDYYKQLLLRERAGEVANIEVQVVFDLHVKEKLVCRYIADFRYLDCKTGELVVIDVKSKMTRKLPTYRLKKKLMASILNIHIVEA